MQVGPTSHKKKNLSFQLPAEVAMKVDGAKSTIDHSRFSGKIRLNPDDLPVVGKFFKR